MTRPGPCRYLLCTDLDRTLLPNGAQPESPGSREAFAELAGRREITLAYVTGRHRELVEQAMREFGLPRPDYVIGSVGTEIFNTSGADWLPCEKWAEELRAGAGAYTAASVDTVMQGIAGLCAQEAAKQSRFKRSFYGPVEEASVAELLAAARRRLEQAGIHANLIWSVDETTATGLLDVLPPVASKLHAIEHLVSHAGFDARFTLFAGDSGNDIEVLCSALNAVLVANASAEVRDLALRQAARNATTAALYLARGKPGGFNGNYSAGIIEGFCHFFPDFEWCRVSSALGAEATG